MIDQYGWTSKQWDELSLQQKAMQIASLRYWSEERQRKNSDKEVVERKVF